LLRWGIRRPERLITWSPRWRTWICTVHPESEWAQNVWDELLSPLEELDARVTRLERLIQTTMPTDPHSSLLIALQALSSIDWITSATIVSELGDFAQFAHPRAVMSRVGLVPSEAFSG